MPQTREIIISEDGKTKTLREHHYTLEYELKTDDYNSLVSLDHYNKRIRVISYEFKNLKPFILRLRELAEINNFGKIIFMAKDDDWEKFLTYGYQLEAIIRYYHLGESAYVMSKFRSQERAISQFTMDETLLIENLMDTSPSLDHESLPEGYDVRLANESDVPRLCEIYKEVFASYPSPLQQETYLKKIMQTSNIFAVITYHSNPIAAASAELLKNNKSAELTDCATLKDHRKKGLMTILLNFLEKELSQRKYQCGFSMARAKSFGMNQIFYNMNYQYMGRLINHCDIYGSYEDMNIWVKRIE